MALAEAPVLKLGLTHISLAVPLQLESGWELQHWRSHPGKKRNVSNCTVAPEFRLVLAGPIAGASYRRTKPTWGPRKNNIRDLLLRQRRLAR